MTSTEPLLELPLSLAQQRLWFVSKMDGAGRAYHISGCLRLRGILNRAALRRALDRVVARHEVLRTRFVQVDGQPMQVIDSEDVKFFVREDDLRERVGREAELKRLLEEEADNGFDLAHGPLIRGQLVQMGEDDHVLVVTMHHIVSDGWSVGVLVNELSALYGAYLRGEGDPLEPLVIQYADYAAWQREWLAGEELKKQSEYWKDTLSGAPARLELATDHVRPAEQDYRGASVGVQLGLDLTREVKALSQRHGVTPYMTVLAGWAATLARLAGQDEVVIGSPVAGRRRVEVEPLIGFFVNTLAIRLRTGGDTTVAELLERARAQVLEAQEHQDLPFEQVVELVRPPRSLARTPVFQVTFAWQNAPEATLELPGLELSSVDSPLKTAKFDLTLELEDSEAGIQGAVNYATALFDRSTMERHVEYLCNMLRGMVRADKDAVSRIPLMPAAERHRVLEEWNATAVEYAGGRCLHELFEDQVQRAPEAVAVVCEEESLTYGELNARANALARNLRSLGVGPDVRVGICVERSLEMMVALVGTLKAGGCYVPLDPEYPVERLRQMLKDSAPAVVLTHARCERALAGAVAGVRTVDLNDEMAPWMQGDAGNLSAAESGLTGRHAAYVIYTSGSTGRPKGVAIPHEAVVNHMRWMCDEFGFTSSDVMLQRTPLSFDASVWECYAPLLVGARLVLAPKGPAADVRALCDTIASQGVSVLQMVPSLLQILLKEPEFGRCASLRYLFCGGEALSLEQVRALPSSVRASVVNLYGPTETTIDATFHRCGPGDQGAWARIGKPVANTQIFILDAHGEPTPIGVAGELHIGGAGLAREYLNQPELTAERFVADPFSGEAGARMYRTGDVGRWLADGTLEYLGRNDFQVKVRGFRIELGEIEARLRGVEGVGEAVVVAREEAEGEKRLVAYYTGREAPEAEVLRAHVRESLPEYMVPAAYVRLEKLPLTPNGKLDRKALPAPEGDAYVSRGYEAPRGEVEEEVARLWSELLKVERVGRNDNFFELGGHSLMAVRLVERMRQVGLQTDVRALFTTSTLAELACVVSAGGGEVEIPPNLIPAGATAITPEMLPLVKLKQAAIDEVVAKVPGGAGNVQDIYPLAPLQEGILFHHMMGGEGDTYLLPTVLRFAGRERLDRFVETMQKVIERHDILRTSVMWEGLDEPVQVVQRQARMRVETVTVHPGEGEVLEQLKSQYDPRHYRLDVREAPLLRGFAAQEESGRWLLLILAHHLALDHTTRERLVEETEWIEAGRSEELPVPVPFRNFVAQARLGVSREEHEAFFQKMLGDVDEPTAPFGLMDVQGDGSSIGEAQMTLEPSLSQALRERARRLGVSAASLMHLAWALVLARVSGRKDVVFGTVMFGRMQGGTGADRVLGMFINTLPVRVRVGEGSVEGGARQTQALLADLIRHEHAPLALAQRCSGVPVQTPLFSSLFNYRHSPVPDGAVDGAMEEIGEGLEVLWSEERTNYPLTLSVDDMGWDFRVTAQVSVPIEAERVCRYMETAVRELVRALDEAPETELARVDVMPAAERRRVLEEWNAATQYRSDRCLHELFEEQVERAPEAVAVVSGEESLTYGELNARANRLGHYLRRLGAAPGARVALCMERTPKMVVGILGVLKAGACYVPLDPAYPKARLDFVVGDSEPLMVLVDDVGQEALAHRRELLLLDLQEDQVRWRGESESNPKRVDVGLTAQDVAYVIYTSGSTGQPKGVMNEHRGLSNLVSAPLFGLGAGCRILQGASLSFDASVWEIGMALGSGASLFLPEKAELMVGGALLAALDDYAITHVFLTPSALATFDEGERRFAATTLIVGGEAVSLKEANKWSSRLALFNAYGPTEAAVCACVHRCQPGSTVVPIGRPIPNTRIYVLDALGEPAPIGVAGELYIGGAGVARGYLNQPELTAERFVADPFSGEARARMYKTGDVGRWLVDGTLEYLGRNDFQVKVRGFRIELGEIEARLRGVEGVGEAVVVAREEAEGEKRLVAYYTGREAPEAEVLRAHVRESLPEYMVPAAYVRLERLPLTPNGKLDRKALPAPDDGAYVSRGYEAPRGEVEEELARLWSDLLKVERVGRNDNFFELGGHSLMAVRLVERMRQVGLQTDVRALFTTSTLGELARVVSAGGGEVEIPPNLIPAGATAITPEMLPLVKLKQAAIDEVVAKVPGGAGNVQDIYPLAPLQEGILFHHMMRGQGDTYLLPKMLRFANRERLDRFVETMQRVIERHDILRTSVMWEGLDEPVQVVQRQARMRVETVMFDAVEGEVVEQLKSLYDPRHYRLDVREAPLLRGFAAEEGESGKWLLLVLVHHLALDHTTLEVLEGETEWIEAGRGEELPVPVPFRTFVAQARLGVSRAEHEAFFQEMLSDVDEPTAPFGLMDVQGDRSSVSEARTILDRSLSKAIREGARRFGVSAASLMHLAWALVLARVSGRKDVVFGTVMLGRMQGGAGADRVLGMFINTLPVRVRVGEGSVEEGARQTQALLADLIRHEHAPLALAQRCSGVPAQTPLFSSLFNYRHSPVPDGAVDGALEEIGDGIEVLWSEDRTNYPLTLSVDDMGRDFMVTAQVSAPIEAEQVCRYMETSVRELVRALDEAPQTELAQVDVMPTAERHQMLEEWNATTQYASDRCLHELFEEQVERSPEAVALVCGEESLTYAELNARANRLAHHLRSLGVSPDVRVGICVERSLEMVVALLGTLKAGGAYVPLDPGYPRERLAYMVEDSAPVIVLVDEVGRAALGEECLAVQLDLRTDAGRWAQESEENEGHAIGASSQDVAYVIYTSGSTGTPKGVMVEHRNVTRLFGATAEWFQFGRKDVWTLFHSFAFDFSVWEIWGALLYGGRLVVVPLATTRSPREFYDLVCEEGVTVLNQTPSAFVQLVAAQAESEREHQLRRVIFGGEALEVHTLRPWYERNGERALLVNMYGITETTVHVTYRPLTARDAGRPGPSPIGKPIPDLKVYVLDQEGEPVPVGVGGEIYVGGAGVARGYLNRPELTAERFVADPFSGEAGARMYKTGDVGRWQADGTLEYLGRNDFQVKVRGFRIELGEIEARLRGVEGVGEAVVVAREEADGEKRLVAYYTGGEAPEAEVLRAHVGESLPEYMLPAAYVRLEKLPLTPNGKLDRKALPAPDGDAYVSRGYEAPRGEIETRLAELWSELLKVERVGRNDNFFELGGHSLMAVRLVERMRQVGLQTDVRALFTTSTLGELARVVSSEGGEVEIPPNLIPAGAMVITPEMLPLLSLKQAAIDEIVAKVPGGVGNVQDIYPLAPLQEGILFHHMMGGEGDTYLLPTVLRFESREPLDRFVETMQKVIERHDILRTSVIWEGLDEPAQVVQRWAKMRVATVAFDPDEGEVVEQLKRQYNPRHYRLDVREAPLLRGFAAQEESGRWLLLILAHHLALDHTTLERLVQETEWIAAGRIDELPEPVPFRNFVARARLGVSREEHEAFFRKMLGDVDEPTAPFGLMDVQGDGTSIREAQLMLEASLSQTVRDRARRLGVSAASLMHLAWALVLARVSGRKEVVFGTVMFGRMQGGAGADRVLGMFINTLPVRVSVGEGSVEEAARQTHALLAELIRHEHAPLALAQRCSGVPAQTPLFSSLLNYRHSAVADGVLEGAGQETGRGIEVLWSDERTNYPLTLSVDDMGGDFMVTAQASMPIAAERVCRYMERSIRELVKALKEAPDTELGRVDVMPSAERHQVLEEWNATVVENLRDRFWYESFEDHVERTPEAVAVVFEDESLTYGELNVRANRLARHLRSVGVVPGVRVAICVERSIEMVMGVLATLKAGGAYVPLDPGYPMERLVYVLGDSTPLMVLVDESGRALVGRQDAMLLDLKNDRGLWSDESGTNLKASEIGLTSQDLAYVIYTSGSTGKPKGVMNVHGGLSNLIAAQRRLFGVTANSRILQCASLSFDTSLWEIGMALGSGARLCLARKVDLIPGRALLETLEKYEITHVTMMPSALALCDERERRFTPTTVIVGGEAVSLKEANKWSRRLALFNAYGPTEATVCTSVHRCEPESAVVPMGRPLANVRIYILDMYGEPAPIGAAGELYIGGAGVARGYLNNPELTAERFVADPFSGEAGARMYKTGDVARWLPDGTVEYLGRNDFQVKVRGFRIELGEIETRLGASEGVAEVVVVVREEAEGEKRLVAYYTGTAAPEAEILRAHARASLPEYMVPAAYVRLERLPLTPNGKLDRKALPAPDDDAYVSQRYDTPRGGIEEDLAELWSELLTVGRVGRNDNFFELGGHSLMAVRLVERMRQVGLQTDVRALFTTSTLAELARVVSAGSGEVEIPPNLIPAGATVITPEMLPLVRLKPEEIAEIVAKVPGGTGNVQDIYPLAPLQKGILFHHMMAADGDAYLLPAVLRFACRERLDEFVETLQLVIERHDILRTLVLWEGLDEPVQVVQRQAKMRVETVAFEPGVGEVVEQLKRRYDPRHYRLDVREAPLLCGFATQEEGGRWLLLILAHHLALDHTTLELLIEETEWIGQGRSEELPMPVPFRNFVAQAQHGFSPEEHEAFFRKMLGDVDQPTAPFGLMDVQGDGSSIGEARTILDRSLSQATRERARRLGVSAASLMHLAWALVLARVSGRNDVVFGTVMFGRMQGGDGADRVLGMFINTLPLRVIVGDENVEEGARQMQALLAELIGHEHAPLALAQRCSRVPAQTPLFSSLFNYRHSPVSDGSVEGRVEETGEPIEVLWSEERTNYPLTLSVDDMGLDFMVTAQVSASIEAERVCRYMETAIRELVKALEDVPETRLGGVDVMPPAERHQVLEEWNATAAEYPRDSSLHELFEEQVARAPEAVAVVCGDQSLTYGELNARANRLAGRLVAFGVGVGDYVAIALERSIDLVIAEVGILKAGAAYVPMDAVLPGARQATMLADCGATVVVTTSSFSLASEILAEGRRQRLDVDEVRTETESSHAPDIELDGGSVAYVMYTSGSTGVPKGVVVPHRAVSRLVLNNGYADFGALDRVAFAANPAFDASTMEVWAPLLNGGCVVVIGRELILEAKRFCAELLARRVSVLWSPVGLFNQYVDDLSSVTSKLRYLIVGGDTLDPKIIRKVLQNGPPEHLLNGYGPTETTTFALTHEIDIADTGSPSIPLGRPISNTRVYVLAADGKPAPIGVTGELHIGGEGVARGYLHQPELTAERFAADPFSREAGARMYKTGDLGRWKADGTVEYLGRNDFQVKIRGFRIELGEIEAQLRSLEGVAEAVVLARQDGGEKRLVAYYTGHPAPDPERLRMHLQETLPDYMMPAAYVWLERLPLTPNGKLERKALPEPDGDSYVLPEYEAPRGVIEEGLARLWSQLLKVQRVGRHDSFFQLGGHSLLAVQLISRVWREFGVEVALRELLVRPTPAAFAMTVKASGATPSSQNLVPIRASGDVDPIFVVHAVEGEVGFVHDLAKVLDRRLPVFGLAATGFLSGEVPLTSVAEMAARYVSAIRGVQPSGPYRVMGYSAGGLIAYAIAEYLLKMGETVSFLGLIDTTAKFGPWLSELVAKMKRGGGSAGNETALFLPYLHLVPEEERAEFEALAPGGDFRATLDYFKRLGILESDLDTETIRRVLRVRAATFEAISLYRPSPLPLSATLFHTGNREDVVPSTGWNDLVTNGCRIVPIDGDHHSIFTPPYLNQLGAAIMEALKI